jgi:hypothetical protein
MVPASYVLAGRICMFHNHISGYSVMSTFFDPALMDSFGHRVTFLQNGITYLLGGTSVPKVATGNEFGVYPNPTSDIAQLVCTVSGDVSVYIDICDATGRVERHENRQLQTGRNSWSENMNDLAPGLYRIRISDNAGREIAASKITKL